MRDETAVTCGYFRGKDHYWQQSIWMYHCKKRGTRTTFRNGKVMQASKLRFRYWFIIMHQITNTKKPIFAPEMQCQLSHKFYEPIYYMMQKIRKTIGIRSQNYQLDKIVELDEGLFESVDKDTTLYEKPKRLKRGRDSEKQSKVDVMASSIHTLKVPVGAQKTNQVSVCKDCYCRGFQVRNN